jgi:hypothetical protein
MFMETPLLRQWNEKTVQGNGINSLIGMGKKRNIEIV